MVLSFKHLRALHSLLLMKVRKAKTHNDSNMCDELDGAIIKTEIHTDEGDGPYRGFGYLSLVFDL